MRMPTSFEQAVQLAERFDNVMHQNRFPEASGPPKRAEFHSRYDGPTSMELGAMFRPNDNRQRNSNGKRLPKLTPEMKQQLIKEGKCFFCRKPGHMALQCPLRRQNQSDQNQQQ
jgi:hypothetical protein